MSLPLRPHSPPATTLHYPPPQSRDIHSLHLSIFAHTGLRAIASIPHPEHLGPGPSTFLQRLSLAWGEDSPIPVASPWVGTPGSLRATVGIARNWS